MKTMERILMPLIIISILSLFGCSKRNLIEKELSKNYIICLCDNRSKEGSTYFLKSKDQKSIQWNNEDAFRIEIIITNIMGYEALKDKRWDENENHHLYWINKKGDIEIIKTTSGYIGIDY